MMYSIISNHLSKMSSSSLTNVWYKMIIIEFDEDIVSFVLITKAPLRCILFFNNE
jgi:methionyl-tRNA synthetase